MNPCTAAIIIENCITPSLQVRHLVFPADTPNTFNVECAPSETVRKLRERICARAGVDEIEHILLLDDCSELPQFETIRRVGLFEGASVELVEQGLSVVLRQVYLSQFEDSLRQLGCAMIEDLRELEEEDLVEIGMKKIEIRRLQRATFAAEGSP
eukprot:COSAG02_NODE_1783_length_10942_cov_1025.230266_2_plen_155_part_00